MELIKKLEQLDEEDLFNIINKRLINVIINKMKNEGNGNTFYKSIDEGNISEKFVSQFLKLSWTQFQFYDSRKYQWILLQSYQ